MDTGDGTPLKMREPESPEDDRSGAMGGDASGIGPARSRPTTSLSRELIGQYGPHKHVPLGPGEQELVGTIDKSRSRYPYAIVWTPLPLITWLIPFIGHMGICDSEGRVYDFAGPYMINEDGMAFSEPTRYLTLDPSKATRTTWNQGVDIGNMVYSKRMHNLCCDNCHSHAARCLDEMGYLGFSNWNMVILCFWMLFAGRWVSFGKMVQSWAPFCLILGVILVLKYGTA
eukprot:CAMPEP_0203824786 /NCGR_PEP_ID=MMETSP0115-20131106/52602_1 /ASSEMBLY_ACC=CAM_ASM_000227 /TAXON_ID=33651 /ORGANISM="Bicosoecid sp, Strain ms1" /LENGTH=228 /DNA_ID=CAMNT_0050733831 /DNA_START=147 /DNA_END=833 /DNA_ORIENTATION=-